MEAGQISPPARPQRGSESLETPADLSAAGSRALPHHTIGAADVDLENTNEKGSTTNDEKQRPREFFCGGTGTFVSGTARHHQDHTGAYDMTHLTSPHPIDLSGHTFDTELELGTRAEQVCLLDHPSRSRS